ncbi:MAG: acetyl-CoA carboxylase biotin carboxyl carrier protein subunit [Elusimicrobia bacterium]|nr:acetyl-CoA carboxylase biotin carboxyl carrier protein subunit [Elusimicrobiota bacterium]
MRYYLIAGDGEEFVADLVRAGEPSAWVAEFEFCSLDGGEWKHKQTVFVRSLAGMLFTSTDGVGWSMAAREDLPQKIVNAGRIYDLYRGYKPSGAGTASAGGLTAQMPGLVVKIPARSGQEVRKGETLLILEAMKMENEIKSALDGRIKVIHVREGETVEAGKLLMELET